jgi:ElaB/YqjD/DUF883 family membrane-anchored ribosome-binding protein
MMKARPSASHGTVEGIKKKLVQDLKAVGAEADDLLKEVANSTSDEFAAAHTTSDGMLAEARSKLDDARTAVTGTAKGAADAAHENLRGNPWKVHGVATAAELIVGFLLAVADARAAAAPPRRPQVGGLGHSPRSGDGPGMHSGPATWATRPKAIIEHSPMYATVQTGPDHATSLALSSGVCAKTVQAFAT